MSRYHFLFDSCFWKKQQEKKGFFCFFEQNLPAQILIIMIIIWAVQESVGVLILVVIYTQIVVLNTATKLKQQDFNPVLPVGCVVQLFFFVLFGDNTRSWKKLLERKENVLSGRALWDSFASLEFFSFWALAHSKTCQVWEFFAYS